MFEAQFWKFLNSEAQPELRDVQQRAKGNMFVQVKASFILESLHTFTLAYLYKCILTCIHTSTPAYLYFDILANLHTCLLEYLHTRILAFVHT